MSEIATTKQRGYCVSLGNLSSLIGTTVAMGMGMKVVLGTDENWPFAIGTESISTQCVVCYVLIRLPFLFPLKSITFSWSP